MRDTGSTLLDKTDYHLEEGVRRALESHGDTKIADLHIWQVDPDADAAIVGVVTFNGATTNVLREMLSSIHEVRRLTVATVLRGLDSATSP